MGGGSKKQVHAFRLVVKGGLALPPAIFSELWSGLVKRLTLRIEGQGRQYGKNRDCWSGLFATGDRGGASGSEATPGQLQTISFDKTKLTVVVVLKVAASPDPLREALKGILN